MIPCLFEAGAEPVFPDGTILADQIRKKDLVFSTYGKGKLRDAISCVVHESLDHTFELEMEYPVNGALYEELLNGGVILAQVPETRETTVDDLQLFDIYKIGEEIDGVITIYARHIAYRLRGYVFVTPQRNLSDMLHYWWTRFITSSAYAPASSRPFWKGIAQGSVTTQVTWNYTGTSTTGNQIDLPSATNVFSLICGKDMLFDTADAELIYDYFQFQAVPRRGKDLGASIRYGKNMTKFSREVDNSQTYNAVVPYWEKDDVRVTVSGYVVQPTTPITPIIAVPLDLSSEFEEAPTEAQLISAAQSFLDTNTPWVDADSIDVDLVIEDLTGEMQSGLSYSDSALDMALGDTVRVYYEDYNVNKQMRVVEYWYDVLAEGYTRLRIGTQETEFVAVTGDSLSGSAGGSGGGGGGGAVRATITIPLAWTDSGNGYFTATPTVDATFTDISKIDLQPDMATIAQLRSDGVEALFIENNSMALTAYAVGNAPSTALTMQCTVTESEAATPPTPTPIDPTIDAFYPVGSIYLAATSLDPNIVFGGTWVRIKDTFLLAAGDTYAGGTTGGEAEHALTVSEMPSHTHNYGQYKGVAGWSGTSPQRNFLKTTGNDGWSDTNNAGYMTTLAAGGGAAHNNMPPYLAIWVWQRTA